ncbi:MAG TPA: cyclopropane-fatty-acyl-phospholipid synthase family protein [Gammaproteobacteria bacterium]|nr:cyclopropane-fatty-acyl-phospholipid synthase family protein [Gammaproteobacteria bacterium]
MSVIKLAESGLLPDILVRYGIRRLLRQRLRAESRDGDIEDRQQAFTQLLEELRRSPIALQTAAANEQHYEVPTEFYLKSLGRHLKYSACWWPEGVTELEAAEEAMLRLTCERAQLADGQRILELGCGWGSLSLWMAQHYPRATITAVSNSATQRQHILEQARRRGLKNIEVITTDMNDFATSHKFDRVVSVEMFEHMRNYQKLMANISGWLRPGGKLFVHIFCHRTLMYPFETEGEDNWMGRHFFTGGLMPAFDTLLHFQERLKIEERWLVNGVHYQKTLDAWLQKTDANKDGILKIFAATYGAGQAAVWLQRWRMFYMACSELFGYNGGTEWPVAHYRFVNPG